MTNIGCVLFESELLASAKHQKPKSYLNESIITGHALKMSTEYGTLAIDDIYQNIELVIGVH